LSREAKSQNGVESGTVGHRILPTYDPFGSPILGCASRATHKWSSARKTHSCRAPLPHVLSLSRSFHPQRWKLRRMSSSMRPQEMEAPGARSEATVLFLFIEVAHWRGRGARHPRCWWHHTQRPPLRRRMAARGCHRCQRGPRS
jgi:hypothetical protein